MVKNEHGGVEIKTLTDGWRDSLRQVGQDHLHEHISEAFLLVGAFTGILQAEPCTFKLQSPQSCSGRRTLASGLPHLWPVWPLTEGRNGERKSDRPGQKPRDPMEGGAERPETQPWGGRVASLTPCCLPDPVPFPLLFRPHLLSDGQDCWALGKTLPGPLTSLCRQIFLLHLEVATSPCPPASPWPITGCLCLSCSLPRACLSHPHLPWGQARGGGGPLLISFSVVPTVYCVLASSPGLQPLHM